MNALLSPGSIVTVAGATLTVIGSIAYATDSPSLSLAGVFYGIPVFLGGLALKSSELPPATKITSSLSLESLPELPSTIELRKLLKDVTRWKYGQKAHLESSLETLKLWNQEDPPQLIEVEEINHGGYYGIKLHFLCQSVPAKRWKEKQDRLGRFFGPDLRAEICELDGGLIELKLLPILSDNQVG
uniref:Thylakoid membrane protein n=1 Tax=Paulinella longichromatophora TaxID=1708747 RepID=A0A2H4ZQQ2_9EUKA|nr:hypothetical protein PLO_871 [Paulinella longichromatophora]